MPIYLPPVNRRRFVTGAVAAGAGLFCRHLLGDDRQTSEDTFLLLADTHIAERRDEMYRGVKPALAMEQAAQDILALKTRPATAIVAGDCAFQLGTPGDYATFRALLAPLRQAGMGIHLTLGNHDHRARFLTAFPDAKRSYVGDILPDKLISVVETPHANWFLLDSLDRTNVSTGLLGKAQLAWLAKALDSRRDRPALVMAHHNPDPLLTVHGLSDTDQLFKTLMKRKHVKAYIFGHTHRWGVGRLGDIHLVNLPPTSYLFQAGFPRGFVTCQLRRDGMTLVLHAIDREHPKHGQKTELKWLG
jgi:3',5'-cyclic-AMP phosphodiesterase